MLFEIYVVIDGNKYVMLVQNIQGRFLLSQKRAAHPPLISRVRCGNIYIHDLYVD